MVNLIEKGIVSLMFVMSPLPSSANVFEVNLKNHTNDQISKTLNFQDDKEVVSGYVDSRVVTKAVLDYFDEEVKSYKLKAETRTKVISILNSYFSVHPVLFLGKEGGMRFVIDDKREFSRVVKQIVNLIIADMPFLVKNVGIPLYFGGNDKLQEKLNNLEKTVMNMKEKQYKDVIFDYLGGIVKRVVKSVNGKMTVMQYYNDVSKYFPNRDSEEISQELIRTGISNQDIKYMKYPFKK